MKLFVASIFVAVIAIFSSSGFAADKAENPFSSFKEFQDIANKLLIEKENLVFIELEASSIPSLQKTIDEIIYNISLTSYGQVITQDILHCNASAMVEHLAISKATAARIKKNCDKLPGNLKNPHVLPSPLNELEKWSLNNKINPRSYSIILATSLQWNYDSWTSSYDNKTTFNIIHNKNQSDLTVSFLTKLIAHELAVYFDAKQWTGSKEWKQVSILNDSIDAEIFKKSTLYYALNNPLISQVLTSIRAFKVESSIMHDLSQLGLPEYKTEDYSYIPEIKDDCKEACLQSSLQESSLKLIDLSIFKLVLSPIYRSRWKDLKKDEFLKNSSNLKEDLKKVFVDIPRKYSGLFSTMNSLIAFQLNTSALTSADNPTAIALTDKYLVSSIFQDFLLYIDMEVIETSSQSSDKPILEFMAEPLLSGYNTKITSGPRPRIRSGGGTL